MTWLEVIGLVSTVIFVPVGMAITFMLFLQWWAGKKHMRKALLTFYIAKLRQENRNKKGKRA